VAESREADAFYEEYLLPLERRMLRSVWRVVHDEDLARDALQDALFTTWKRRDRVRVHPNPEALILRICIHAAVDVLRRDRRRRDEVELPRSLAAGSRRGPAAVLEARAIREQVLEAVARLPTKQATAVLMRVLDEHPYRAIAETLECAEVTARIHVMRGRARLRRLLAHLVPGARAGGGET
jgi:RNA polymerase sigma factor (sigma-70 family)